MQKRHKNINRSGPFLRRDMDPFYSAIDSLKLRMKPRESHKTSLSQMMSEDVTRFAGDRYEHCPEKPGYRWGQSKVQVGFHGGKIDVE